jgi:hypothetical protein
MDRHSKLRGNLAPPDTGARLCELDVPVASLVDLPAEVVCSADPAACTGSPQYPSHVVAQGKKLTWGDGVVATKTLIRPGCVSSSRPPLPSAQPLATLIRSQVASLLAGSGRRRLRGSPRAHDRRREWFNLHVTGQTADTVPWCSLSSAVRLCHAMVEVWVGLTEKGGRQRKACRS